MYAIIRTGGKQTRVRPGDVIQVELLKKADETVSFTPLLVVDDAETEDIVNPKSLEVIENTWVEPALADAKLGDNIQFERTGYFCLDPDSKPGKPVFNRTVTLKDSWAKLQKKG